MENIKNNKCVLYCRVSSREQEDTGYSLPAQEKLLKSYTEKKNFRITKKFSISESASGKKQREIFTEMINYTKQNNIKIILCEKVDRLTRNFRDAVKIDDWLEKNEERQVHLVKDSLILHKNSRSQEKLNWGIRILFAKNYIDNLSEETKKGQIEKLNQGWLPQKPPLGYKTTGEKGHKIHILDTTKAPLIKKMFELYATGNYSLSTLNKKMYQIGLKTNGENKLVRSRLAELLSDPFYYGKIRWNNKIYNGKQEPTITEELFNRTQNALRRKNTPKYSKHFYLFKGLVNCTECKGPITWEKQKETIYGHCNHYRNCSQKKWAKETEVEKKVIEKLDQLKLKSPRLIEWIRKALKENHKEEIEFNSTSLNELNKRHKQLQKRLDRLYDDKLDDKITGEFYEKKFKQYSEGKEEAVQSIQEHSQSSDKYFELGINIYELSQKGKEIYLKATQKEKRKLLQIVFNNLSLNENKLTTNYSPAFQILSNAVRLTNSSKIPNQSKLPTDIFEPVNLGSVKGKNRALDPACPAWLRRADSNRRHTG